MARSIPRPLSPILILAFLIPLSWALKFDIAAHTGHSDKYERCIRNHAAKSTLVVVTATVDGHRGDGQVLNMHVS
jgi:p24 family protein delta-1